jgi:hypothetical protein
LRAVLEFVDDQGLYEKFGADEVKHLVQKIAQIDFTDEHRVIASGVVFKHL